MQLQYAESAQIININNIKKMTPISSLNKSTYKTSNSNNTNKNNYYNVNANNSMVNLNSHPYNNNITSYTYNNYGSNDNITKNFINNAKLNTSYTYYTNPNKGNNNSHTNKTYTNNKNYFQTKNSYNNNNTSNNSNNKNFQNFNNYNTSKIISILSNQPSNPSNLNNNNTIVYNTTNTNTNTNNNTNTNTNTNNFSYANPRIPRLETSPFKKFNDSSYLKTTKEILEKNNGVKIINIKTFNSAVTINKLSASPNKVKLFPQPESKRIIESQLQPEEMNKKSKHEALVENYSRNNNNKDLIFLKKVLSKERVLTPPIKINDTTVTQITTLPGGYIKRKTINDDLYKKSLSPYSNIIKNNNDYHSQVDCLNYSLQASERSPNKYASTNINDVTKRLKISSMKNESRYTKECLSPNSRMILKNKQVHNGNIAKLARDRIFMCPSGKQSEEKGHKGGISVSKIKKIPMYGEKIFKSQITLG